MGTGRQDSVDGLLGCLELGLIKKEPTTSSADEQNEKGRTNRRRRTESTPSSPSSRKMLPSLPIIFPPLSLTIAIQPSLTNHAATIPASPWMAVVKS
jgi:hypothetical protein